MEARVQSADMGVIKTHYILVQKLLSRVFEDVNVCNDTKYSSNHSANERVTVCEFLTEVVTHQSSSHGNMFR